MNEMEQNSISPRRKLWVAGAAVVVALIIVGGALYALLLGTAKKDQAANTRSGTASKVASADTIKQNISKLNKSIDQLNKDRTAAKTAADDGKNQVKVGG